MSTMRAGLVSGYLSLFASATTLVCCAIPALLVLLGLGAATASALSAAPWLVTLSQHKDWVFLLSGALIAVNGYYVYRLAPRLLSRQQSCPPGEDACATVSRWGRGLLWISVLLYGTGFFVAYALAPILVRLSS